MKYQNDGQAELETRNQEPFLEAHLNTVFRFCLRLCGGRSADAEDLAQDVLIQAWQHQSDFAGRSKITTWLRRIALNRHLRLRSSADKAPPATQAIENASTQDHTASSLERLELTRALDELPDNLRTAFLLVKVEGCKYREAADILGVPVGTVQWHVYEAVQHLRVTLLAEEPTSGAVATTLSTTTTPKPFRKENAHALQG